VAPFGEFVLQSANSMYKVENIAATHQY